MLLKPGEMTIYEATEPHRAITPRLSTVDGAGAITASMISSTVNQLE